MNTEAIIATLLAAATCLKKPMQEVAGQSIKGAYGAIKAYLRRKFGEDSEATNALEMATAKPESLLRKSLLIEESASADLGNDAELGRLAAQLAALLPVSPEPVRPEVRVVGDRNRVQIAGRDLIHTEKVVHRNAITPDDRHLNVGQREKVRGLIAKLASRLPGAESRGKISAVHAMLQRRFGVASYLLIPSGQCDAALSYLNQQCAIQRSRLLPSDPVAYCNELYRVIYAGAANLGWDGQEVYRFAGEKLALKKPLMSLKELGPVQLKSLAGFIRTEVADLRFGEGR